ncbi:MAG: class I SAM-dependent methyltransferase [Oscillospiraceae bacterium]|jgi:ubiquinone/menaquinone biosynthesis C-methylase UbiE|nr:class I SAM-dependent methyltransferase [Oscillospiraceae bacterium]
MFEKHFNRKYEMGEFPYFVPKDELEYNLDYAKSIIENKSVARHWKELIELGGIAKTGENITEARKIISHGGLILEICAGPAGGYMPAVLLFDYNANIMINDLCPTVVREWQNLFKGMNNPPPYVEYATFSVCDIPFKNNCIDVVSGYDALINIEGNFEDFNKALMEIHRVLKPGGLFVFNHIYVSKKYYEQMPLPARDVIKVKYPFAFWDSLNIFDELGYSNIEEIPGETISNEDDDGDIAILCRSLNTYLEYSQFVRYCVK